MFFFFFNDTATTEIYTLSLHDALPICQPQSLKSRLGTIGPRDAATPDPSKDLPDRKSTRLNSSHLVISYAVFCLKKKKKTAINNATAIIKITPTNITSHTDVYSH